MTTEQRWYVVQTHARAEAKAASHLMRQGFRIYLPRYSKRRRHARRIETVLAPLFPSYLFVTLDRSLQRWRSIHSTVGVVRLVCNGEEPAPLPDSVISGLKAREDENGIVRLQRNPMFAPGDTLKILDGIFSSHLGLFESMTDSERVAVLLDLLGRKVRVIIDAESVAAA